MNSSVISFFVGLWTGAILGIMIMAMFRNSSSISRYEEEKERCDK